MSLGKDLKNTLLIFSLKELVLKAEVILPVSVFGLQVSERREYTCVQGGGEYRVGERRRRECCRGGSCTPLYCNRLGVWAPLSTAGLSLGIAKPYRRHLGTTNFVTG